MSSCVFIIQYPAPSWAWDISTGIMKVYRCGCRTDPRLLAFVGSHWSLLIFPITFGPGKSNSNPKNLRCALDNLHNVATVLPTPSISNIAYSLHLAFKTLTQDQYQATPSTYRLAESGSYLPWHMSFVVPFGGYNTCTYTVLLVDAREPRLEKGQLKDDIFELTKMVGTREGVLCPLEDDAPSPPILEVPPSWKN